MLTVRFSSGYSIQYYTANHVKRFATHSDLYEKDGGRWVAQVSNDCVIESIAACRTYFSASISDTLRLEIEQARKEIRSLTRKIGKMKLTGGLEAA